MASPTELATSIRVVSNRTGIGPHTLRAWERRYGFPHPRRRPDGVRAYSEADIAKLKLVARALELGFRASEVVPLSAADVTRLVEASQRDLAGGGVLDAVDARGEVSTETTSKILAALRENDIDTVRTALRDAAEVLGPKRFVTDLAAPLALQLGDRWERGEIDIRHEHLLSACLTRQLHAFHLAEVSGPPVVVLATLPGEHHVLPLDMIALYLAAKGASARMLGADIPAAEIAAYARASKADAVGISISRAAEPKRTSRAVRELVDALPRRTKLWLGGAGSGEVHRLLGDAKAARVETFAALDEKVDELRGR